MSDFYAFIWETWESLKDDFGIFAKGNDLNKKYSDVTTIEVFQYVDDLELKFRFRTVTYCALVNNLYGKVGHFKHDFGDTRKELNYLIYSNKRRS